MYFHGADGLPTFTIEMHDSMWKYWTQHRNAGDEPKQLPARETLPYPQFKEKVLAGVILNTFKSAPFSNRALNLQVNICNFFYFFIINLHRICFISTEEQTLDAVQIAYSALPKVNTPMFKVNIVIKGARQYDIISS